MIYPYKKTYFIILFLLLSFFSCNLILKQDSSLNTSTYGRVDEIANNLEFKARVCASKGLAVVYFHQTDYDGGAGEAGSPACIAVRDALTQIAKNIEYSKYAFYKTDWYYSSTYSDRAKGKCDGGFKNYPIVAIYYNGKLKYAKSGFLTDVEIIEIIKKFI